MDNINWKDIPAFLDEEQRKDPLSVIQSFFEETSLYDARIHLTLDLLEANQLLSEMITQKKLSYTTEVE